MTDASSAGKLAGAGRDVVDPKPLPRDPPLWGQADVVITSHIAGQSQFSQERVQRVFVDNAARFAHGLPMLNVVDKAKGY